MNTKEKAMEALQTCLWFDSEAEDAAKFYTSIFKNSTIGKVTHFGKEGFEIHGRPEGSVMTIDFELNGMKFSALNGGPMFKFNESISFQIWCDTQEEIDRYWTKLSEGGDPAAQQCGWLKDKYGLSWQVIPRRLTELLFSSDKVKSGRAMNAMLQMKKMDISQLEQAYEGRAA
jgi:predicted 3-demethylubiquinone-9 3-methyltransferase (glyoxalase superfamily)